MRRGGYSLPDERPHHQSSFGQLLQRHWPKLLMLEIPPLAAILWRGITRHEWGVVIPGMIAAGIGFILWHGWLRRRLDTNHGIFTRHATPIRYWLNISLLSLFYSATIAVTLFIGNR